MCNHAYRGVDGPAFDKILLTKVRVNEVNTPAAENVARVKNVTSTLRTRRMGSRRRFPI